MDKALILIRLQAAEEVVSNGKPHIAQLRDLLSRLRLAGRGTTDKVRVLREMETMQKQHIAERDRLRAELAVTHPGET